MEGIALRPPLYFYEHKMLSRAFSKILTNSHHSLQIVQPDGKVTGA